MIFFKYYGDITKNRNFNFLSSLKQINNLEKKEHHRINKRKQIRMNQYYHKLGPYHLMVASQYFDSIDDFKNMEYATKKGKGNMEKFHFNPIE